MSFAEVFLRLGAAFVGWMVIYAHIVWLAALYAMGCGPDGSEMHALLLGLVPLTGGCALLLAGTRPFPEVHAMLRWLGVPLLLLLPFALRSIWEVFVRVNVNDTAICGDAAAAGWHQLWVPVQVLTLVVVAVFTLRVWRDSVAARRQKMP